MHDHVLAATLTEDLWVSRPSWRQVTLDIALAGFFTAVALIPALQQGGWLVAATGAMGLALCVWRVSLVAMVVFASLVGVIQAVVGELAFVADLGYAPVFFLLGGHPRPAVRRLGLVGAGMSAAGLSTLVGSGHMGNAAGSSSTVFAVLASAALALLVAGGGWTAGYVRWQNRARITAQVRTGLEQERSRIAADMHDLVAHTWAVVAAQADGARYALKGYEGDSASRDRRIADALDVIGRTARASIADLRGLLHELRYEQSAAPANRSGRADLLDRMRASGMDIRVTEEGQCTEPGWVIHTAQHLLGEALTNALKHGDLASPIEVFEDWREGYRLVVRNRIGTVPASPGTGHGLVGMRDRVLAEGGELTTRRDGEAWVLQARLPSDPSLQR